MDGFPEISLHAYAGLLAAFAQAGTSLAGRAFDNLLSLPAQAVSAVVPSALHVFVSLPGIPRAVISALVTGEAAFTCPVPSTVTL